jgi:hypothetical protein
MISKPKTSLGLHLVLVSAGLLLATCSAPEQPLSQSNFSQQCVMDFSNEDSLNLTGHVKDTTAGQMEILNFQQNISTTLNSTLPFLIDSIYSDAFCALKDSADRYHVTGGECVNYFTALEISYGLNPDFNAITVLYQPVYLCKISGQNNYAVNYSRTYYKYNPASSSFVLTTDTSSFKRYTDSILISHTASDPPSHFQNPPVGNDTLGDVRSVIFPFQEIAALISDNKSPYLKIWNAVRNVQVISAGETLNKHDLLLGPVQLHIPLGPITTTCGSALFCNKFANLGGLCPPSCNIIYY